MKNKNIVKFFVNHIKDIFMWLNYLLYCFLFYLVSHSSKDFSELKVNENILLVIFILFFGVYFFISGAIVGEYVERKIKKRFYE